MKHWLKSGLLLGLLGVLLCAVSLNAATYHVYFTGIVTSFGNNEINVNNKRYILAPKVTVLFQDKQKGSYYEKKGSLSDIRIGQPVIVKAEGSSAHEILIERWKQ